MSVSLVASGLLAVALAAAGPALAAGPAGTAGPSLGPVRVISSACAGQNAEVQTATDPATNALYEEWIGCGGIGFARSGNGGAAFSQARELPGSAGGWDPAITVGGDGTVYAAFMVARAGRIYPVVDISRDGGVTFPVVSPLGSPRNHNWGDRDFIAVNRSGTIFVTWDYGPKNDIRFVCDKYGSCSFTAGDVNVVVQRSTNGGRSWGRIIPVSHGFPASGADSGPIVVEPGGRVDVLYQAYKVLNRTTLTLGVAHNYFTTSTDGGLKWSKPLRVGPARLWMNTTEWWIDGAIGMDSAGGLYATWDSQSGGHDVGWLEYSTTRGRTWSRAIRVTPFTTSAMHLVQVLGGRQGIAYVGWLTDAPAGGYVTNLRAFSVRKGWLTQIIRVSVADGNRYVWPGDTIGLSLYPAGVPGAQNVAVSWGGGIGGRHASAQIRVRVVGGLP